MYLKADSAKEKWRLVFKVMCWNTILVTITVAIMYYFGQLTLNNYKNTHPQFFLTLGKFSRFFWKDVWETGILEEILFRGPAWILSSTGLILYVKNFRLHPWLIGLAIFAPNYFWAIDHSPATLPVFIAGLGYSWLVVRTKSLWPAVIAHSGSNLLIYLAIKIATLFLKI